MLEHTNLEIDNLHYIRKERCIAPQNL